MKPSVETLILPKFSLFILNSHCNWGVRLYEPPFQCQWLLQRGRTKRHRLNSGQCHRRSASRRRFSFKSLRAWPPTSTPPAAVPSSTYQTTSSRTSCLSCPSNSLCRSALFPGDSGTLGSPTATCASTETSPGAVPEPSSST